MLSVHLVWLQSEAIAPHIGIQGYLSALDYAEELPCILLFH